MDNFAHDFIDGCKREGIKDPSRLKYTPKHYLAVFVEMTSNGKNPIRVKEYHRAVGGGEYKVAKVAFNLLNKVDDAQDRIAAPRPPWFQQFVASTAGFVQDLWEEISMEIQREVEERVQVSEAARNMAEKEQASTEEYLEEIIAEKQELEITIEEFAGYRERNEELHHELKDLVRDKQVIEDKLSEAIEEVNFLRVQMTELQSLKIQLAKVETELDFKTQQVMELQATIGVFNNLRAVSDATENHSEHAVNQEECDS
ncbi:V-type ATP synthase subunit I domain-containing protein [Vibrio parahaemolyticus]|uniref:hypothetical protein n=2 Tax=Vibrio harveyi group TaxID=717610 RepID=UPI0003F5C055|nr:hypothetical protein [Vibrio parahaemolyticus]MDF4497101.1 hypothetical protein [Vibrio parahaemolyticus]MDG3377187.1 hypothetical protein [Vibrio parahaemolyticus]TOA61968.1 hypothetical protein CGK23_08825 [Vibrio parahaemolyticus]TOI74835.1 hypothetical protein CGI54_23590 [Vibrio parahaemolyticus]HCH1699175.1 hypothetical protein [Vibrio parahaemolyticus]